LELTVGSTFGPYRILGPLGRGGMASVYRARDPALERDVALKVLPAEFLHDTAFAERFRQEARVAGRLEHPHIVPVHAFGIEQGAPWMAMRLVTGGSLAERLRRGPLPPSVVTGLLRDVAGALDYAHKRGVVHRDVKPANVLLDEAGRAYLADFGVARMLEGSAVATATGVIHGTPSYMAPEQALGEKADRLADVYALGVVAFECLTGRVPYTGTTSVAILMKHVKEPVPEPTAAEMTAPLSAVLRRCLAKAPGDRWPSAGIFAAALDEASAGGMTPGIESTLTIAVPRDAVGTPRDRTFRATVTTRLAMRRKLVWASAGAFGALALVAFSGGMLLARQGPARPAPRPADTAAAVKPTMTPTAAPRATPRPRVSQPTPTPGAERSAPGASATGSVPARDASAAVAPTEAAPGLRDAPLATLSRPVRVYCEAKLEPFWFRETGERDVADSLKDLLQAIEKREHLALAATRVEADAVVQVLERGREPARIGMRKVRVRVFLGGESVELTGQDSSFNTWSRAAGGAAKEVETWLVRRMAARGNPR
jgi:serine/threonine-protein kinase